MPSDRDCAFPAFRQGMEHEHYDWQSLYAVRPGSEWLGKARVAVCVVIVLEHAEWQFPAGSVQPQNLAGGYGCEPFPDVTAWSRREYGNRMGVFRVLDVLMKPQSGEGNTAFFYNAHGHNCTGGQQLRERIQVAAIDTTRQSVQD